MKFLKEEDGNLLVEFTSIKGVNYVVGFPTSAGYQKDSLLKELTDQINSDKTNDLALNGTNWYSIKLVPGGESEFEEAKQIGIVNARVEKTPKHWIYSYILIFENDINGTFEWKDESGDIYTCRTFRKGKHTIRYNSPDPTMVAVRRS